LTRQFTVARKMVCILAAAVGVLLYASAHAAPTSNGDSPDTSSAAAPFHGHFHEALGGGFLPAQRITNFDEIRSRTEYSATGFFDEAAVEAALLTADVRASVGGQVRALSLQYVPVGESAWNLDSRLDTSQSDPAGGVHHMSSGELPLASRRGRDVAGEREVLLRNSDPLARARVTLGKEWLFVYADVGTPDSTLGWQALVGIRVGQDARLLGGWRHTTYFFSPGKDFDALDFEGPFLGAQRSW